MAFWSMRRAATALVIATTVSAAPSIAQTYRYNWDFGAKNPLYAHVLLISVDGLHAIDLQKWIADPAHANGAFAQLAQHGVVYPNAYATAPSDSFPGLIAQVTGGTPRSTGVFYDDSYDRTLFASGSNCEGPPGAEVQYAENIDRNTDRLNAGGTLGNPLSQIDVTKLPMSNATGACLPVLPHQFIRVNTIFEVVRAHGGYTAWADKHPAYEILNGPSGAGIDDLFTPEINSLIPVPGNATKDNTTSFNATRNNDEVKVQAILNEIARRDSTGTKQAAVPSVFGMNFQSVSVGQKLATSGLLDPDGLLGGYTDADATPGNALTVQLAYVDDALGRMITALRQQGLLDSTLVIVSAKHGQSPIDRSLREAVQDAPYTQTPGYGFHIADDVALVWLAPQTRDANLAAASAYLQSKAGPLRIESLGGPDILRLYYQDPATDSRTPDFIASPQQGVIYTSGAKLAEHGGLSNDDRNVALLVSATRIEGEVVQDPVETRQIAPTILRALGLDPRELQAVRLEGTKALPGTKH